MSLINVVEDVSTFQTNIQNSLNDRISQAGATIASTFGSSTLQDFNNNLSAFKLSVNPQANPATNSIQLGATSISANGQDPTSFFNALPSMDVWQVQQLGTALTGLVGGRAPVIPMVFGLVPPLSATSTYTVPDPLYLFVNPKTWSRSANKVQTNNYVRNGITTERWGEELEQITASGNINAFYSLETGLTRFYRRQTPSFRNLMMLLQLFKNNGCAFDTSYSGNCVPSANKRIIDVGAVEIFYDKEVFRGTFDTFSVKEAADKPFTLEYSFTFFCESTVSILDIINVNTAINAATVNPGGPGSVQLAPGQQPSAAVAASDALINQELANQINETALNATEYLQNFKTQSLTSASAADGYQPSTNTTAVLLQEQLTVLNTGGSGSGG